MPVVYCLYCRSTIVYKYREIGYNYNLKIYLLLCPYNICQLIPDVLTNHLYRQY